MRSNETTVEMGKAPTNGVTRRRARALAGLFLVPLAVAFVACEGDNLFNEGANDYLPRLSNLSVPNPTPGDTMYVRVEAQAVRGVAQVVLSVRGALQKDTTVVVEPPQTSVSIVVPFYVPLAPPTNDLFVQAHVIDAFGKSSRTLEVQATVDGPPAILNVGSSSTVTPGAQAEVTVSAVGTRPITSLLLHISGAVNKDTTVLVVPARTEVNQVIRFSVPVAVQDTILRVEVTARDDQLRESSPVTTSSLIELGPPTMVLTAPPTGRAGDNLAITVAASGPRNISKIIIQLNGDPLLPAVPDVNIVPQRQNVLPQVVNIPLPAAMMNSIVTVQAFAVDVSGAVSEGAVSAVSVPLDRPEIELVEQTDGTTFTINGIVRIRVTAHGDRPLSAVNWSFSGADFRDLGSVAVSDYEIVKELQATVQDTATATLNVHVTVTDAAGEDSDEFMLAIPKAPPPTAPLSWAPMPEQPWLYQPVEQRQTEDTRAPLVYRGIAPPSQPAWSPDRR